VIPQIQRGGVPPSSVVEVEAIAAVLKAWEDALVAAKESDRAFVRLERSGRHQAEAADAEDLARALEEGKPPPKAKHLEKYERDLSEARRQASATRLVEARRWDAVLKVFDEHGGELEQLADRQIAKARDDYLRAVDELERRHQALSAALGWKQFFGRPGEVMGAGVYLPGTAGSTIKLPPAHTLDDSRVLVSTVLAELREVGAPPPPEPVAIMHEPLQPV
jgi:hypothetical protein